MSATRAIAIASEPSAVSAQIRSSDLQHGQAVTSTCARPTQSAELSPTGAALEAAHGTMAQISWQRAPCSARGLATETEPPQATPTVGADPMAQDSTANLARRRTASPERAAGE